MQRLAVLGALAAVVFPLTARAQECVPSCRSGYTCRQGSCVSLCNPPCAAQETCTAAGECVRPALPEAPRFSAAAPGLRVNEGWARAAGIIGSVSTGVLATLSVLAFVDIGRVPGIAVGASATIFGAVIIPVTAAGAGSARVEAGLAGLTALRVVGWVSYGLFLSGAASLIGLGIGGIDVPSPLVLVTVLLSVGSAACMTTDAFVSAAQVSSYNENRAAARVPPIRVAPYVAVVPLGRSGDVTVMAGLGMQL